MPLVSLEYLHQLHRYYLISRRHPCRDEDVHELRRKRSMIARMIADWNGR
jgi:hypothetical protein